MPAKRPRNSCGMILFHKLARKIPLHPSNAPDNARKKQAQSNECEQPKPIMANPQQAAERAMAWPSCLIKAVQPLQTENNNEPTAGAA